MTRSRLTLPSLIVVAFGVHGCAPTHLRSNAPGHIDVRKPPQRIAERTVERPVDPGEHRLALTFGALTGGGFTLREGEGDDGGGFALSLEVSAHYRQAPRSHHDDSIMLVPEYYPLDAIGVNLGYQAIAPSGDIDLGVVRPFYLELQYSNLWWAAAGWQADFESSRHGPQLTGGLGPFYLRLVHLFDTETQLELGVVLKGWHVWVWSR